MKNKKNKKNEEKFIQDLWTRLAVLIIAMILFYPIGILLLIMSLISLIYTAVKQKPNPALVKASDRLSYEINRILRYLLFVSKERPLGL